MVRSRGNIHLSSTSPNSNTIWDWKRWRGRGQGFSFELVLPLLCSDATGEGGYHEESGQ